MTEQAGWLGQNVPACGPQVWFAEIMTAVIQIASWIIDPLFAADGPLNPDAVPAYVLVTSCAAFLTVMGWAIRYTVKHGSEAVQHFYANVVIPAATAHVKLMEALRLTREQDSESLKSLSRSQEAILEELSHIKERQGP